MLRATLQTWCQASENDIAQVKDFLLASVVPTKIQSSASHAFRPDNEYDRSEKWPCDSKYLQLQVIPGEENSWVLRGQLHPMEASNWTRQNGLLPGLITLIGDTWTFHADKYHTYDFLPSCQTTLAGFEARSWLNCEVTVTFSRVTGIYACDINVSEPGGFGTRAFNLCFDSEATCTIAIAYCTARTDVWTPMKLDVAQARSRYSFDSSYWLDRMDRWFDGEWVEMSRDAWASNCDADMDFGDGQVARSHKVNPVQLDEFLTELTGVIQHSRRNDGIKCDHCFTTTGTFTDFLHCTSCPRILSSYTQTSQMFHVCRTCAQSSDAIRKHNRQQQLVHSDSQTHRFLDPRDSNQLPVLVDVYHNAVQFQASAEDVVPIKHIPLTAVDIQTSVLETLINEDDRVSGWDLILNVDPTKQPILQLTQSTPAVWDPYYLKCLYERIIHELFPGRTCNLRVIKPTTIPDVPGRDVALGREIPDITTNAN